MLGWHFLRSDGLLRNGLEPPENNVPLIHTGELIPCEHFSEHPFDALKYAPGPILCRVECGGELISHGDPIDKYVCSERTILWRRDITAELRRFACDQALSVADKWDMPDVVRNYLENPIEQNRDAAQDAAWDAAWDAARDAAWYAAGGAAGVAAWDAAWAAARDAAREEFKKMIESLK